MNKAEIITQIKKKKSLLCIGLDTDIEKIPAHLKDYEDPVYEFNKQIIDATKDHCVAYKPNVAFYEMLGSKGWESLKKTIDYIPRNVFSIADAKRADIGNTSKMYAKTFFEDLNVDAVTVNPYMGEDSVMPFLEYENKWTILLALTSNRGNANFQKQKTGNTYLFEEVLLQSKHWGTTENMMYVVGATEAHELKKVRGYVPNHFLLIPGIGKQGGSLQQVIENGYVENEACLLINASRSIIYASQNEAFDLEAAKKAQEMNVNINQYITTHNPFL